MKQLIIIGARAFGREVYHIARESKQYMKEYEIKGFLDSKSDALDNFEGYPDIISSVEDYDVQDNDIFICALGNIEYKKHYAAIILSKGGKFISIIHPTAYVSPTSKIGVGCILSRYVTVSCDVKICNFVTISTHTGIGHDVQVDDWCHIGGFSNLSGGVKLEESVTIHPQANIVPYKVIHSNAIVGVGSVVLNNVKAGTTVFGNPAKKIDI